MSLLLDILLAVLLITASGLCIYLILSLSKANKTITQIQRDINKVANELIPLLERLDELTNRLNSVVSDISSQLETVRGVTDGVKSKIANILGFSGGSGYDEESSGLNIVKTVKSVVKGIMSFWSRIRNR